ncbi:MAG: hypothetical protein II347_05665 [Lachnospiraceae bacterium]|nr:hypothetical protein [Lachnospiraceae bacterium]
MRLVTREKTYNTMDKNNAPAAVIQSGETVQIQTKQNNGDWLQSIDDRWDPSKSKNGPNLCTVVAVEGACPGDTLAVRSWMWYQRIWATLDLLAGVHL